MYLYRPASAPPRGPCGGVGDEPVLHAGNEVFEHRLGVVGLRHTGRE